MFPRLPISLSLFRQAYHQAYRLARRRPLPVIFTVAVAIMLTFAAVSAGGAHAADRASNPDAIGHAGADRITDHAGTSSSGHKIEEHTSELQSL